MRSHSQTHVGTTCARASDVLVAIWRTNDLNLQNIVGYGASMPGESSRSVAGDMVSIKTNSCIKSNLSCCVNLTSSIYML